MPGAKPGVLGGRPIASQRPARVGISKCDAARCAGSVGYPFVASTLPELEEMLDRLRGSAALRQAASRMLLDMARYLLVRPLSITRKTEVSYCLLLLRFEKRGLSASL